ncbi:MAG TPA: hypothetical protein VGC15_20470 [Acetobacteraceae bacterium]
MNDFDALLAELGTMSKAMQPTGDAKVEGAAKEAGAKMPEGAEGDDENKEDEQDDEMFGKSFQVTLSDGSVQEAFDGTEMMKALAGTVASLRTEQESTGTELSKALLFATSLTQIVQHQGEMLKSLRADLAAVSTQGRGRQAAVTVLDKGNGTPAPVAAAQPAEIMAKAMTAFHAGSLTGQEVARLEAHFGRGLPAPADIVARLPA